MPERRLAALTRQFFLGHGAYGQFQTALGRSRLLLDASGAGTYFSGNPCGCVSFDMKNMHRTVLAVVLFTTLYTDELGKKSPFESR